MAFKWYFVRCQSGREDSIRKHAELSGIPISQITEVPQIIDPLTANN